MLRKTLWPSGKAGTRRTTRRTAARTGTARSGAGSDQRRWAKVCALSPVRWYGQSEEVRQGEKKIREVARVEGRGSGEVGNPDLRLLSRLVMKDSPWLPRAPRRSFPTPHFAKRAVLDRTGGRRRRPAGAPADDVRLESVGGAVSFGRTPSPRSARNRARRGPGHWPRFRTTAGSGRPGRCTARPSSVRQRTGPAGGGTVCPSTSFTGGQPRLLDTLLQTGVAQVEQLDQLPGGFGSVAGSGDADHRAAPGAGGGVVGVELRQGHHPQLPGHRPGVPRRNGSSASRA